MDRVERPKPLKDDLQRPVSALDLEEARRFLECLEHETYQWRCFIRLLLDVGCRRGELVGLLWKNVNFKNNTISIANCLEYTPRKGTYTTTPKNRQLRTIDVDPEIMDMLRHLPEHQSVSNKDYVFVGRNNGKPMHPDTPTSHFRSFREKNGFDLLTPHVLRHTAASIALLNSADIASVSEILGHSDKAVTLRVYSHADEESKRRASQTFLDALTPKKADASGT